MGGGIYGMEIFGNGLDRFAWKFKILKSFSIREYGN
jgi:hypothetical protein